MNERKPLSRRTFLTLAASSLGGMAALAACGAAPTATPPPPAAAPTAAPKAAPPTVAPTPAPAKATTVTYWPKSYVPNSTEIWGKAVANVMSKKPNLKIDMAAAQGYTDAEEQKLITAMASGTGPDVWNHGGSSGTFWGAKGVALALEDMLKASPLAGDHVEAMLAPHTWKGHVYALPWGMRTLIMQWRKDIFTEVGLNPEAPPKDWTELGTMGQKLATWKGNEIQRVGFGMPVGNAQWHFGLFMYENGGQWFSDDFKKTRVNEQPGVEALQFMVDLLHKYKVNSTASIQSGTAVAPMLLNGQMAMDWAWLSTHYSVAKKSQPDLLPKFGVAQPPKGPKSAGQLLFCDTFLVNATSKVKDAACEFLVEMESYENLETVTGEPGFVVPRKSWYDKFPDKVKADPGIAASVDAIKVAYPITWGPQWTPFRIALIPALDEALLQKRTPKEALDAFAAKANTEILAGV